jgi:hypothetical protein
MGVPCSEVDKQLFRASTIVTVGNGELAKFWESSWCDGVAPRDLAPNLYQLAWRKNLTLWDEVQGDKWTRGLWRMSTAEQMVEFVCLWSLVQEVQFNDSPDAIRWKWTADGCYSAKSAYNIQFAGSYCSFDAKAIWKAKTEGKHRFFMWLLVHEKILTADNLRIKGIQCDPICALCDQVPETAEHLCLHCVFAKEVWLHVQHWSQDLVTAPRSGAHLLQWWNDAATSKPKDLRPRRISIMMYTVWHLWKEHNRRVFDGKSTSPRQIMNLIKEELQLRLQACGGHALLASMS